MRRLLRRVVRRRRLIHEYRTCIGEVVVIAAAELDVSVVLVRPDGVGFVFVAWSRCFVLVCLILDSADAGHLVRLAALLPVLLRHCLLIVIHIILLINIIYNLLASPVLVHRFALSDLQHIVVFLLELVLFVVFVCIVVVVGLICADAAGADALSATLVCVAELPLIVDVGLPLVLVQALGPHIEIAWPLVVHICFEVVQEANVLVEVFVVVVGAVLIPGVVAEVGLAGFSLICAARSRQVAVAALFGCLLLVLGILEVVELVFHRLEVLRAVVLIVLGCSLRVFLDVVLCAIFAGAAVAFFKFRLLIDFTERALDLVRIGSFRRIGGVVAHAGLELRVLGDVREVGGVLLQSTLEL